MAATIPVKIEKFVPAEKDEFSSIAQANWQKMSQLMEYLNRSYPIGMLLFFMATQDELPELPDPKYWQLADGSVVANSNSPLNGQTLPDLRDRFIRHPTTGEPALTYGGNPTVNTPHDHGGQTGFTSDVGASNLDSSNAVTGPVGYHNHSIGGSSNTNHSTIPQFRYLQVYVRIA
jgi:hypothetical protein